MAHALSRRNSAFFARSLVSVYCPFSFSSRIFERSVMTLAFAWSACSEGVLDFMKRTISEAMDRFNLSVARCFTLARTSRIVLSVVMIAVILGGAAMVLSLRESVSSINGSSGPFVFAATTPITVSNVANLITYACPTCIVSGGAGFVSSVSNIDGTLTISPTTGAVVASLNLGHANTWTATQTFGASGSPQVVFSQSVGTIGSGNTIWMSGQSTPDLALNVPTGGFYLFDFNNVGKLSILASELQPGSDNAFSLGDSSFRFSNAVSNLFSVYHASGDANPSAQLGDGFLKFGAGVSSLLDTTISRTAGTTLSISGNWLPSSDATYNLGSTTIQWNIIYSYELRSVMNGALNIRSTGGLSSSVNFYLGSTATPALVFGLSPTGIIKTQGFQTIIGAALGNPSTSTTLTLPVTEPDATYAVTCTPNFVGAVSVTAKTTTNFVVNYPAIAVGTDTMDCIVVHQ